MYVARRMPQQITGHRGRPKETAGDCWRLFCTEGCEQSVGDYSPGVSVPRKLIRPWLEVGCHTPRGVSPWEITAQQTPRLRTESVNAEGSQWAARLFPLQAQRQSRVSSIDTQPSGQAATLFACPTDLAHVPLERPAAEQRSRGSANMRGGKSVAKAGIRKKVAPSKLLGPINCFSASWSSHKKSATTATLGNSFHEKP